MSDAPEGPSSVLPAQKPVTIVIPSPEAATTVGTADAGGNERAERVAAFVDSVAASVSITDAPTVSTDEIRADVEDLRKDFEGTLARLREEDAQDLPPSS